MSDDLKEKLTERIRSDLLPYAKTNKPILLSGNYDGDLFIFMSEFHKMLRGKEPLFNYVGKEEMPEDFSPDEYLAAEMKKAIEDRNHERIYELFRDFKCTENTYKRIDCQNDDGETVLEKLTGIERFTQEEVLERISSMMRRNEYWKDIGNNHNA